KIAIIAGAGPAGLTAAYELIKRTDITPIVLEATDAIGGIAQTYNYKGNRIDIGGHRFFSKSERVMNWWFNILPPQGKPSADTEEKKHDIDYVAESVVEYLCPECIPECRMQNAECKIEGNKEKIKESDPEKEDDVMLQRPRISRIFYNRNFFPYPIGITLKVAGRLGWINTFLIGMSYIKAQIFPEKDETYLDGFFKNRFGRRLYATFFRDYTEKVWGVPCCKIKADWGAQRIKGLSLKRAVVHAVKDLFSSDFSKAQKNRETSLITRFYYPKYGPGQMWEKVRDQINCCGGEVKMGKRVVGVKYGNEAMDNKLQIAGYKLKVTSVTVEDVSTGNCEEMKCDYFFSTMPVRHLINQMHPQPPDRVQEVAEGLIYRDFLTVGLLLKKLHVKVKGEKPADSVPDNWIYIQEGDVRVGRVQVFNNWSPYMVVNNKETTWIGLEYFVDEGDDLWIKKDEDMIKFGIEEMEKINFLKKEDVLDSCVLRMPKAYPAYFGSYDNLHVVKDFATQFENMFLIGRNGMHRYNNQDHSMLTAMKAVDNICEGRVDSSNIWEVNAEEEYHEEKS
ncbi:MAG: NAD(P)/FAD-dependent oxidoreductase, partial [Candidatus Peribacteraceae bacterium]|nr:NAD(P)/FAD-dependent oxidoreductase [Candidatus Peribacteraceae bacterium]